MIRELDGRVAVVTGAASGIGRALASAFRDAGCAVALADVDALEAVVKEFDPGPERPGGAAARSGMASAPKVLGVSCDVRSNPDLRALRNAAVEAFGPVDVVCLNAGVSPSGPVLATTEATWRWLVDVNLLGVVNGLSIFGPELVARGQGHIVITASVAGLVPTPSLGPYSAVKHALVALAEVLRQELDGSGVGVSVLCPGVVRTRIHESERSRPADLAGPTHTDPGLAERYRDAVENAAVTPESVAEATLAAIRGGKFMVFSDQDAPAMIETRAGELLAYARSER